MKDWLIFFILFSMLECVFYKFKSGRHCFGKGRWHQMNIVFKLRCVFPRKVKADVEFQGPFPSITQLTNHKKQRFSRERGSKEMPGMLLLRSA